MIPLFDPRNNNKLIGSKFYEVIHPFYNLYLTLPPPTKLYLSLSTKHNFVNSYLF